MRKLLVLLASLSLYCAACVSVAELPERAKITGPLPKSVQTLVIRQIAMKAGAIKNVDGLTDAPQLFARALKEAVELKQPAWQVRLAETQAATGGADLTVATEIIDIDGGSAGLRFWIGFSAGAAQSTVAVSLQDKSEKELATAKITERTMCPIGACVESNDATVRRNLQELAVEVAEFIVDPAAYEKKKESGS